MRLELIKDVWLKMQDEFEKRAKNAQSPEEQTVYQYMVEMVIPSEIEFIDENEDDEHSDTDDFMESDD